MMSEPVALQRCAGYDPDTLEPALDALLDSLGGLESFVEEGHSVLLKPNLIAAHAPERGATTHPAVLASLARRCLALGARPFIGDAPAWGSPVAVARNTGVSAVCEALGIAFVNFDRRGWLPSLRPAIAAGFHVDPRALGADVIINCGKFKAHQQLGFTACVKNLYGVMPGREKAWHHLAQSRTDLVFARYVATLAYSLPVALHVTDAIVAMERSGPRFGVPRPLGVLAASRGAAEVDAVLAEITGAPPGHRMMLDAIAELELGETDARRLEILGSRLDDLRVDDFQWPELIGVFFSPARLLRGWLRQRRMMARQEG